MNLSTDESRVFSDPWLEEEDMSTREGSPQLATASTMGWPPTSAWLRHHHSGGGNGGGNRSISREAAIPVLTSHSVTTASASGGTGMTSGGPLLQSSTPVFITTTTTTSAIVVPPPSRVAVAAADATASTTSHSFVKGPPEGAEGSVHASPETETETTTKSSAPKAIRVDPLDVNLTVTAVEGQFNRGSSPLFIGKTSAATTSIRNPAGTTTGLTVRTSAATAQNAPVASRSTAAAVIRVGPSEVRGSRALVAGSGGGGPRSLKSRFAKSQRLAEIQNATGLLEGRASFGSSGSPQSALQYGQKLPITAFPASSSSSFDEDVNDEEYEMENEIENDNEPWSMTTTTTSSSALQPVAPPPPSRLPLPQQRAGEAAATGPSTSPSPFSVVRVVGEANTDLSVGAVPTGPTATAGTTVATATIGATATGLREDFGGGHSVVASESMSEPDRRPRSESPSENEAGAALWKPNTGATTFDTLSRSSSHWGPGSGSGEPGAVGGALSRTSTNTATGTIEESGPPITPSPRSLPLPLPLSAPVPQGSCLSVADGEAEKRVVPISTAVGGTFPLRVGVARGSALANHTAEFVSASDDDDNDDEDLLPGQLPSHLRAYQQAQVQQIASRHDKGPTPTSLPQRRGSGSSWLSRGPPTVSSFTTTRGSQCSSTAIVLQRPEEPMSAEPEEVNSVEDEAGFVDEFGFVLDEKAKIKEDLYVKNVDGCRVLRAEVKWASIASDWTDHMNKKAEFIKRRCRKGIPGRFRGVAWQLLLQSRQHMNKAESVGIYAALRDKKLSPAAQEVDDIISRDLDRTFPTHVLFREKDGSGQRFLRRVLHAYAAADPEVGYVQGMGFVVCALSTQLGEEETFWALHMLMHQEKWQLRELYRPDFPMLHQFFYQLKRLLAKIAPRLHRRFEEYSIEPSFYASQWFLTVFVGVLSFRALLRVWDVFLYEGWKMVFRVALALLKGEEAHLLELSYDELLLALKALHEKKNADKLMRDALNIKFKTSTLQRYKTEYWTAKAAGALA